MGVKNKKSAPSHLKFAVLAVDVALFCVRNKELLIRLIPVNRPPHFPDSRGLPGGLVWPNETAEKAAFRLITDKGQVDVSKIYIEQLSTFSAIERDPRGRVVAVAYLAVVPWELLSENEKVNSSEAWWQPVSSAKNLAYDHDDMLTTAIQRIQSKAKYTTLVAKLMPMEFTLSELEAAYEAVVRKKLDKRNFRKKILKQGALKPLKKKRAGGRHRPAELYSFKSEKVVELDIL